jgi:hypothetical protein
MTCLMGCQVKEVVRNTWPDPMPAILRAFSMFLLPPVVLGMAVMPNAVVRCRWQCRYRASHPISRYLQQTLLDTSAPLWQDVQAVNQRDC